MVENDQEDYYYTVGGGVKLNELAEDAVRREVFEETGMHYEIDRLAVIHENIFYQQGGRLDDMDCHEIALYYLMKPQGTQETHGESYNSFGDKERLHWIPVDELDRYKFFPDFLQDYLRNPEPGISYRLTDMRR